MEEMERKIKEQQMNIDSLLQSKQALEDKQ
jgi:hypothetical protein